MANMTVEAGIPGAGPTTVPNSQQINPQQIMQLMRMIAARQQGVQGPQGTPGVVGTTTPGPQAPGAMMGTMPQPTPSPMKAGYQPPAYGSEMMSKLDPSGGAVFTALQGVQQVLQQHEQRKDQKEHAEAANIAQNLMQAMSNNDVATVHEILNDPKQTKILNKVYKGWLQKQEASNQPQEPPDPAVSGFEQGVAQHVQKKQAQKKQQQQPQYRLPQASIAQQAAQQQAQNALRQSKAEGSLSDTEMQDAARMKQGLIPNQAQLADIAKAQAEMQKSIGEAQANALKAASELKTEQLKAQEEIQKSQALTDQTKLNLQIRQAELSMWQTRAQMAKQGGKLTPQQSARLSSMKSAASIIDNITSGKGDTTVNTLTGLQQALNASGLGGMARQIQTGGRTPVTGKRETATQNDELTRMKPILQKYIDGFSSGKNAPPPDDGSSSADDPAGLFTSETN